MDVDDLDDFIIKPFPKAEMFKMSDSMYEALRLASQRMKIPEHMKTSVPNNIVQRVNLAWALIGKELGFKWWTVKPIMGKKLEIWAEPV